MPLYSGMPEMPEDLGPFLVVLLVNASILLFTLLATYSAKPNRWHALSFTTSALYLFGLFALLNEWDLEAVFDLVARAPDAILACAVLALRSLATCVHALLLRALWLHAASALVVTWALSAMREMRHQVRQMNTQVSETALDAKDLRMRLDRCSGSAAALQGLANAELQALEAAAQKSLTRIREHIDDRRRHADERSREDAEARLRCVVCMAHPKEMTFQCGHRTCVSCASKVEVCPQCRAFITLRIRSYD